MGLHTFIGQYQMEARLPVAVSKSMAIKFISFILSIR